MPPVITGDGRRDGWITAAATSAVVSIMLIVAVAGSGAPQATAGAGYLLGLAALFVFPPYALYRAFRGKQSDTS